MTFQTILPYCLEVLMMSSIGAAFYLLVIRKEHRLHWNRAFLIFLMISSCVAPLFSWTVPFAWSEGPVSEYLLEPVLITETAESSSEVDWGMLVLLCGAVLSLGLLTKRIVQLLSFRRQCLKGEIHGAACYFTNGTLNTSSFWSWLFWDESDALSEEQQELVLRHEQCHIQERHSADLLLAELLLIPFWWNPAFHLIRSLMVANHEALADRAVLSRGMVQPYRELLLRQWLKPHLSLTHEFHYSHLKHRIDMLSSFNTPRQRIWKYFLLVPVFTFSTWLVSCQSDAVAEEAAAITEQAPQEPIEMDQNPQPQNLMEVRETIGYPKAAHEEGIEGQVLAKVLIGPEGEYVRHEIVKSDHVLLEDAVVEHLKELTFTPAIKDGQGVNFWITIPFTFKLIDGE